MPQTMEADESPYPRDILLLSAIAVMAKADRVSYAIEQPRLIRTAVKHPGMFIRSEAGYPQAKQQRARKARMLSSAIAELRSVFRLSN
jgi:hypothetical protein